MGLCVLYYVEYSLFNVKKVGFFLSGLELHFKFSTCILAKYRLRVKNQALEFFCESDFLTILRRSKLPILPDMTGGPTVFHEVWL